MKELLKKLKIQLKKSWNKTPICKSCFKELKYDSLHSILFPQVVCLGCINKLVPRFKKFKLDDINALTIYFYGDLVKEKIFLLKGCEDYELSPLFISYFRVEISLLYFGYYLVRIPSYIEDDNKRGFNHVEEIFKCIKLKRIDCLIKTKKHKQSDQNYEERHKIGEYFKLQNEDLISGKKILIVDDICTTGSSLRAAISMIKKCNPKKIKVLVIAKREFSKEEKAKLKGVIDIT